MPYVSRWAGLRLGLKDFCSGQMGTNVASIKKIRKPSDCTSCQGYKVGGAFLMNDENKTVTKITEPGSSSVLMKSRMTEEQLCGDYKYCMAQKIIKEMLDRGLISVDEFNKISERNRQTFSPYLAEIMP